MLHTLYFILFNILAVAFAIKTHQFHFAGSNIAYGNGPKVVHITGNWYIRPNNAHFQQLFEKGYNHKDLQGVLYVCTRNVEMKMTLINEKAENTKSEKIRKMSMLNKDPTLITPYIDPKGCEVLQTSEVYVTPNKLSNQGYVIQRFNLRHNFTSPGLLLFIDAWGVASFHYREKSSDALKLQYCENEEAAFPVIFNKRPICPRPALPTTKVEKGKVTIYKPNIMSVQKQAHQCYIENTLIETFRGFFGHKTNNLPLATKVKSMEGHGAEFCRRWIETKKCFTGDLEFWYRAYFNDTIVKLSDTLSATVNPMEITYEYLYEMSYSIVNCKIRKGYVRTSPPFKTLITPWGNIPNDYLYKSNYTRVGGEVIVWDAFEKEETCNFVPMNSFDAKRITYDSKAYLEQDPHTDAQVMYHFVSDAEKSVYTSDDTQITDPSKYNCVSKENNQTLYVINNGLLLSWELGESVNDDDDEDLGMLSPVQKVYHPHYAFNELTETVDQCEKENCTISAVPGGSTGEGGEGEECDPLEDISCRQSYSVRRVNSHGGNITVPTRSEDVPKLNLTESDNNTTPLFATVAFLQYKFEQYQNDDVIRRAQAWCENQQHIYDLQRLAAFISPSSVISSYLNRPVSAESIGNGVFKTHYCQTVTDFIVADSLFVDNPKIPPYMGGKTFKQIYKAAGVDVRPDRCFTMPIIIFKDSLSTEEYRVGQLQPDQSISTNKMPYIEECKIERYFFHVIGKFIYVFENYRKLSVTLLQELYDHASRLETNVDHLNSLKNTSIRSRKPIEPLLEDTQFIDIYTKYEPKLVKPIVLGFTDTEMYDYRTRRRTISSLEDLIAYVNVAKFDDQIFRSKTGGKFQRGGTVSFENIVGAVGKGFKIVVDGIGDGVNYMIDTVGDTVDNVVEETNDILGSVVDFFKGGVLEFILVVAGIAVCALFIYYLFKHKLLANDDEEDDNHYQQPYNHHQQYVRPYDSNLTLRQRQKQLETETFYSEF